VVVEEVVAEGAAEVGEEVKDIRGPVLVPRVFERRWHSSWDGTVGMMSRPQRN
jgi:hypothetical protein